MLVFFQILAGLVAELHENPTKCYHVCLLLLILTLPYLVVVWILCAKLSNKEKL